MRPRAVAAVVAALVVLGSVPFVLSPATGGRTEAVAFDRTKSVGLPDRAVRMAHRSEVVLPKAEVFYSQYRYVVGYYGLSPLVASLRAGTDRSLGRPLTVYVTEFSGSHPYVNDDGYLSMPESRTTGWIPAREAFFVVNSSARLPTRKGAVVPFETRADAADFVESYGGRVRRWEAVRRLPVGSLDRSSRAWRGVVRRRQRRATESVTARRALRDRPVSVVVGEDAPSLARAVAAAPPNTTVYLPPGTYDVSTLRVTKPLTVRGAGPSRTRLVGDGTGSVVVASAPETAVVDLSIAGVGERRSGANRSADAVAVNESAWSFTMRKVHGYGDAAVVFDAAPRSLVSSVAVETPSNGVIARDSPDTAVANLTVVGTKRWEDGFLGVSAVGSRVVVQNSTFYGGKVGVFAFDARGSVVRDSSMEGMMLGVFSLFGWDSLVADNHMTDVGWGVSVETHSYNAAAVNNTVTGSGTGVLVAGMANYVAGNTLVQNRYGLAVDGHYSLYEDNVVAYDGVGFDVQALVPTNRVRDNDVLENEDTAVVSSFNVLHVWPRNYWARAPGAMRRGDHRRRAFRPVGPVDGAVGRVRYAGTVAHSPAVALLRAVQRRVPGLRARGVVDPSPRVSPARPATVARVNRTHARAGRVDDGDAWEFRA